ncbi:MAG: (2Fe-2S)-binding protein [Candidatus Methanosuratincola sp.]
MALCPSCRKKGLGVEKIVVINHSRESTWPIEDADWYLCEQPGCDVVYFTKAGGRVLKRGDVKTRVALKETTSPRPLCYCKMVTEEDVVRAIEHGARTLAEVREATGIGGGGFCALVNPGGSCCSRNYVPFIQDKLKFISKAKKE